MFSQNWRILAFWVSFILELLQAVESAESAEPAESVGVAVLLGVASSASKTT